VRARTGRCWSAGTATACPSGLADRARGAGGQRRPGARGQCRRLTPTPAVSHAILRLNRGAGAGATASSSHRRTTPPRDGGIKYNPPHGGPADSDATGWIASRANELIAGGLRDVRRKSFEPARAAAGEYDFLGHYVDDLPSVLNLDVIRSAGLRIGADPLGGASVDYWAAIAERHRLDLTVVNPQSTRRGSS
jgi:phosphoglucomutase